MSEAEQSPITPPKLISRVQNALLQFKALFADEYNRWAEEEPPEETLKSIFNTLTYCESEIGELKSNALAAAGIATTITPDVEYFKDLGTTPAGPSESLLNDVATLKADMTNVKLVNGELKNQLTELSNKFEEKFRDLNNKLDEKFKGLHETKLAVGSLQTTIKIGGFIAASLSFPLLLDVVKRSITPAPSAVVQPATVVQQPVFQPNGLTPEEIQAFREWVRQQSKRQTP